MTQRRRYTPRRMQPGDTMTTAEAAKEPADPEADAGVCGYEADLLNADALRGIGFYPTPDLEPPF